MNNYYYLSSYTCVILRLDTPIYTSSESGIKPLMNLINENIDVKNCTAVDKIVGKAAALLYIYMGVTEIFADVLGKEAFDILKKYGVKVQYNTLTEKIINRRGDGICPMEEAVVGITEPTLAVLALKRKLTELTQK